MTEQELTELEAGLEAEVAKIPEELRLNLVKAAKACNTTVMMMACRCICYAMQVEKNRE